MSFLKVLVKGVTSEVRHYFPIAVGGETLII